MIEKLADEIAKARREKCKNADRYLAIFPPRCGCKVCEEKWARKAAKRRGGK